MGRSRHRGTRCCHAPAARFWSGKAIRLPKPPWGSVSWLGKKRSYESSPMSGRRSIVSVKQVGTRACAPARPESPRSKNSQTARLVRNAIARAPPADPRRRQVSRNARASSCHPALSKSTARKKHVSSEQQRVDASDEGLPFGIASRQVPADDVVGDRQEAAVRAFRALDPRLLADARAPIHSRTQARTRLSRSCGFRNVEGTRPRGHERVTGRSAIFSSDDERWSTTPGFMCAPVRSLHA